MLGETVKIKKEHKKAVKALVEELDTARSAHRLAVGMYTAAESSLWATLRELYPEVKGFSAQLNTEDMEIHVKARTEK